MAWWKRIALIVMVALVIGGHIALWRSDDYGTDVKLRLTILNALGWGIIVLPAFAVAQWAKATERRNREDREGGDRP